jgi:hypothetical protein
MPALPAELKGTYTETQFNNYPVEGTVAHVRELLNKAVAFRDARNVEVYCGEFGVNMYGSPISDRVFWHQTVRSFLEENNIPWTIWAYQSGFGIFNEGSNELYDYDMNVALAEALGFTVPTQSEFLVEPEAGPFTIYTDFMCSKMIDTSWGTDVVLDFHSDADPKDGKFCLHWSGADQYNQIGFDFVPDRDLSVLVNQNYQLSFYVKGDTPGTSFDIRFVDTDTDVADDYGWRMRYTVDGTKINWDGQWHKLTIPLKNFKEYGVYDNGWHEPNGKFDWSAIDRFEIASENQDLKNKKLWFDQIEIVVPPVINYTVSATVSPVNTGTVAGAGTYDNGKQVTLTATPKSGYQFVNWTLNGIEVSKSATYSFTVSKDASLKANFKVVAPATFTVTATANPQEGGVVTGSGTFNTGTLINLTATPNEGYKFTNWTNGETEISKESTYSFALSANYAVQANFSSTTSISEINDIADKIRIFPNPTNGILNIKGLPNNSHSSIVLYANDGRKVINKEVYHASETDIDFSNLKSGIYFIVISGDSFIKTQKIVRKAD